MPPVKTGRRHSGGAEPKPTEIKRRLGNPGGRPLPAPPTPDSALEVVRVGEVPTPPDDLGLIGLAKWDQLWTGGRRHLSEIQDAHIVHRLCRVFDELALLEDYLAGDVTRGWYTTKQDQIVTHPAIKRCDTLSAQMITMLGMLGFSPTDRARLGLAEVRVANELDEYRTRKTSVVDGEVVSEQ